MTSDLRLLLVHAHPDDETITTGATMAYYAAQGVQVTLVTCTRGEEGEIIPPSLASLTTGPDGTLGPYRVRELADAMAALGVSDHRFLAEGLGFKFIDSGMALDHEGVVIPSPSAPPGAFAALDRDDVEQSEEEAALLADVMREVRPHVVITYEPGGGYGHPDHVRAHVITMRALELAALEGSSGGSRAAAGWTVPKVYWIVVPLSLARATLAQMAALPDRPTGLSAEGRLPSMMVPDEQVTTIVDARSFQPAKAAALRAHATQVAVTPDDAYMALSNGFYQPISGTEYYRLVRGELAGPFDASGRETDLFSGFLGD